MVSASNHFRRRSIRQYSIIPPCSDPACLTGPCIPGWLGGGGAPTKSERRLVSGNPGPASILWVKRSTRPVVDETGRLAGSLSG